MATAGATRGFALAVAVFALVLIAALLAGVFFAAAQELRMGRGALAGERAFAAAEAGVSAVLASWDPARYDVLDPGEALPFGGATPSGTGAYAGSVTRLGDALFLVRATGRDASGNAFRTVGQVVRLAPPALDIAAAFTVERGLLLSGSSLVSGVDRVPDGWNCVPASGAGVRVTDPSLVSSAGCARQPCVEGSPAVIGDAALGDSSARRAVEAAWAALSAVATRTYAGDGATVSDAGPVGTPVTCDSSVRGNWGEPDSPPTVAGCAGFFPVIVAPGDLRIGSGRGQGILLVSGDLEIGGGFRFRGLILVRGKVTFTDLGGGVLGGVVAASAELHPDLPGGVAEVLRSTCAVRAAMLRNAAATPLVPRGWVEVF